MENFDSALTSQVKALAIELGADLIGIAPIERFAEAPIMMHPRGLLPDAQAVISVAIHHPDAVIELDGEPTPHDFGPYNIQGAMNSKLDHISFHIARFIEEKGYKALALPVTNVWRYRPYKDNPTHFAPDLSHIHAAVAAGLGEIGLSGLLLTPEFGPRQRITSIITSAPLEPTPLYSGEPLCDRCQMCVKACKETAAGALSEELGPEICIHIGEREFHYLNKNKWRCAWAEHFSLNLSLPKPEKIDEGVILKMLKKYGRYRGEMGSCLRYCMIPQLRISDPSYTRVWRRKRCQPNASLALDRVATLGILHRLQEAQCDFVGILTSDQLADSGLNAKERLPDVKSIIVFGCYIPPSSINKFDSGAIIREAMNDFGNFAELSLCQFLERLGYSVLPLVKDAAAVAAVKCNLGEIGEENRFLHHIFGSNVTLHCLFTSAPLESGTHQFRKITQMRAKSLSASEVKHMAAKFGADLVGIAPVERFHPIIEQLRQTIDEDLLRLNVRDLNVPHGVAEPRIEVSITAGIRTPEEHLEGARSVIVIGVHFPFANIERAALPPAEAVGPYAYAHYQTLNELRYVGAKIVRWLDEMGYRAALTFDLLGSSSVVSNPRGLLPDAFANNLPAVLSGLGTLGLNGAVITPQFGLAQRFIAIVTDALIEPTPLQSMPSLCDSCSAPCIKACPVGALDSSQVDCYHWNNVEFRCARRDIIRCDWAKKYGLVGDEGPKFMGSQTDIHPPEGKITVEQIVEAMKRKDPIQKHWLCIAEPCILACHRLLGGRSESYAL